MSVRGGECAVYECAGLNSCKQFTETTCNWADDGDGGQAVVVVVVLGWW